MGEASLSLLRHAAFADFLCLFHHLVGINKLNQVTSGSKRQHSVKGYGLVPDQSRCNRIRRILIQAADDLDDLRCPRFENTIMVEGNMSHFMSQYESQRIKPDRHLLESNF